MESKRVNIATAKVNYGWVHFFGSTKNYYSMWLETDDSRDFLYNGLDYIALEPIREKSVPEEKLGDILERKNRLFEANLRPGTEVVVLFEDDGQVIAISKKGDKKWMDVRDKFTSKTFGELGIDATSLRVF